MKLYDAVCPICGTKNTNMFLEETDGWMECEHCHKSVKVMEFGKRVLIPVYSSEQLCKMFGTPKKAAVNQ